VAGHRSRTTDRIADPKLNPDVSCRRWPAHSELLAPLMNDESDRGQNSLAAKLVLVFHYTPTAGARPGMTRQLVTLRDARPCHARAVTRAGRRAVTRGGARGAASTRGS
jgi:hypothetical protein